MQLTTLVLAGLSAVSVSAVPSWISGEQVTIQEEYKVPGDNPLYFCGDPADDILKIEKVDLDPNPPKPYVYFIHSLHRLLCIIKWRMNAGTIGFNGTDLPTAARS